MPWNGEDRRKGNREDSPMFMLAEIRSDLKNYIKNFDDLKEDFHEHKIEDSASFNFLKAKTNIGIGIILAADFFIVLFVMIKFH